jgi:ketosteroid isomerase-like protein
MSEHDVKSAVLRANERFYQAFTRGDFTTMRDVWAEHAELTCLHPGSSLLHGQREVLGAWQQILTAPAPVALRCHDPQVQVHGDVAIVTCYEGNAGQAPHLAATNIFLLENERWRMVHHQAGPLAQARPAPPTTRSGSSMN